MHFFKLKKRLREDAHHLSSFADGRLQRLEHKLVKKIEKDEHKIDESRKLFSKVSGKLKRNLDREFTDVDEVVSSYNKESVMETRAVEKVLRREAKWIVDSLLLLQELVQNEEIDIIYDLKNPLDIAHHFIKKELPKVLSNNKLLLYFDNDEKKQLRKEVVSDVAEKYELLLKEVLLLIKMETKQLRIAKLQDNLKKLSDDMGIIASIKERTAMRRSIVARTQHIIAQLKEVEKVIKKASKENNVSHEVIGRHLERIASFSQYFNTLIRVMLTRIDIAHRLVMHSELLQGDHLEQFHRTREALRVIYDEFIDGQKRLRQNATSEYQKELINKRIKQFYDYKKEMSKVFGVIDKNFQRIEDEELKIIRKEESGFSYFEKQVNKISDDYKQLKSDAEKLVA